MPSRVTAAAAGAAILLGGISVPGAYAAADSGAPNTVQLTTTRGDAPVLRPGIYQTASPRGTTEHYASVTRPKGGSVAVAIFGAVNASLTTADGQTTCSSGTTTLTNDVTGYTFVFADSVETARQSYLSDGCASATRLLLKLSADDSSDSSPGAAPAQLRFAVTAEPKVTHAGAPAPKSEQGTIKAPSRTASGRDITLSENLFAPTTLAAGSHPVTLRPGTIGVTRVRVSWGQRLAASVDAPRNGSNIAPPSSLDLELAAFSPQWAPVGAGDGSASLYRNDSTEQTASTYTTVVGAANRSIGYGDAGDVGAGHAQWTTAAGWYYLVVRVAADDHTAPPSNFRLPARLNIAVTGTATAGPSYVDAAGSAVAAPPASQLSRGGSSGSSTTTVLRIAGTALVLVVAGAAVVILLRRRA